MKRLLARPEHRRVTRLVREVASAIKQFAAMDPRFYYFRVESNIHIVPGNRYLLERARGTYLVPIDSDDRISRSALSLLAG